MSRDGLTVATVRAQIRELGLVFKKTEYGEYRVNRPYHSDTSAYYTDSLRDALDTAYAMDAESKAIERRLAERAAAKAGAQA